MCEQLDVSGYRELLNGLLESVCSSRKAGSYAAKMGLPACVVSLKAKSMLPYALVKVFIVILKSYNQDNLL